MAQVIFIVLMMFVIKTSAIVTPDILTPVHDGLLITTHEDVRIRTADWTILVVIHKPPMTSAVGQAVHDLYQVIYPYRESNVSREMVRSWLYRLDMLKNPSFIRQSAPGQKRRSLIDFGGTILNKLFGTATEEEINQIKTQLARTQQRQQILAHE